MHLHNRKKVQGYPYCCGNGIWIEIEGRPITRLGIGSVIGDMNSIIIIDDGPQTITSPPALWKRSRQIAGVCHAG